MQSFVLIAALAVSAIAAPLSAASLTTAGISSRSTCTEQANGSVTCVEKRTDEFCYTTPNGKKHCHASKVCHTGTDGYPYCDVDGVEIKCAWPVDGQGPAVPYCNATAVEKRADEFCYTTPNGKKHCHASEVCHTGTDGYPYCDVDGVEIKCAWPVDGQGPAVPYCNATAVEKRADEFCYTTPNGKKHCHASEVCHTGADGYPYCDINGVEVKCEWPVDGQGPAEPYCSAVA